MGWNVENPHRTDKRGNLLRFWIPWTIPEEQDQCNKATRATDDLPYNYQHVYKEVKKKSGEI